MVESLVHRQSVIPAENLKRWQSWKARIESKLGPGHAGTLTTWSNIAAWTGRVGNAGCGCSRVAAGRRVLGRDIWQTRISPATSGPDEMVEST